MTVPNSTNLSGPYNGNGVTTSFAYNFRVIAANHVCVVKTFANGTQAELVINTDYVVTGVGNAAGGSIVLSVAPAAGETITVLRNPPFTQETDLENQGAFHAQTIEDALDLSVMRDQLLLGRVNRAIHAPDTEIADMELPVSALRANRVLVFDSEGNATVSEDNWINQAAISAAYASSAASSASSAASSASSAVASYTSFRGIFYGAYSSDPALDPNGNVPTQGDIYFNTSTLVLRVYNGSGWSDTVTPTPTSYTTQLFSGTGAQTAFTMSGTPSTLAALEVFISGSRQRPTTDYTFSGTTLTFITAPASGTNNILVRWTTAASVGVPNDGSVSTAKIQDAAVTGAKIADGSITSAKIVDGTIATADLADAAATYAKIQNVSATSRILGRATAGAGVLEELTLTQILDFIGSATRGDILFRGASAWTRLPAGTVGQYLQTQGATLDPQWANVSAGGMTLLGTLTTTSGATQTLSGLSLTGYRALYCVLNGVKSSTADRNLKLESTTGPNCAATWGSSGTLNGFLWIDLQAGYFHSISGTGNPQSSGSNVSNDSTGYSYFNYSGKANYSSASTSIVFAAAAGNFNAGSISVYGVK